MQLVAPNDPILRTICRRDFSISLNDLHQMFFLMREKNGLGLAAPQVGIPARLFVTGWGMVFVDPQIVARDGPCPQVEGCLSLPGIQVQVRRWRRITLFDGETYEGIQAQVIQHELDHLNGVLITNKETTHA
jgi:peptide deformylase